MASDVGTGKQSSAKREVSVAAGGAYVLTHIAVYALAFLSGMLGLWLAHLCWPTGMIRQVAPLELFAQMFPSGGIGGFAFLLWPLLIFVSCAQICVWLFLKRRRAVWCLLICFGVCFAFQALMNQLALGAI